MCRGWASHDLSVEILGRNSTRACSFVAAKASRPAGGTYYRAPSSASRQKILPHTNRLAYWKVTHQLANMGELLLLVAYPSVKELRMTHTTRFCQFFGIVVTLACAVTMAQERSVENQETGSPASKSTAVESTAALVRTYNVQFSTYLGGSGADLIRDMTVDAQGNVYVAGVAGSADFPRTAPAIGGQSQGGGAMVAKLSAAGKLIWSKVVGRLDESSYFYSVKVDKDGSVFVAGRMAPRFPTTPGAFQPTAQHNCGFVGKLKPDASAWVWASYVGTGYAARDMTMDDKGDIYCVLDYFAESREVLPAGWFSNAFQKTPHGGGNHFGKSDAGVIKISNHGKVLWATWLGGSKGNDWVASLGVGADHCPAVLLRAYSEDMPTTPGTTGPTNVPLAGWLGKLSADGTSLLFGTYVADANPRTHNVAVDRKGNVFICTCTEKWPVTAGAFQTKLGGGPQDFGVAKFSPAGRLLAATYLGGNGDETNGPDQIVVDAKGDVVVAGSSSSTDFPVTPGAFQAKNAGAGGKYPFDGVVSILSNDLSKLVYSSYIGGTGDEMARACCAGSDGTLYVGGVTTSRDFPVKNAYQENYGGDPGFGSVPLDGKFPVGWGNGDCWVAKFVPAPATGETNPRQGNGNR